MIPHYRCRSSHYSDIFRPNSNIQLKFIAKPRKIKCENPFSIEAEIVNFKFFLTGVLISNVTNSSNNVTNGSSSNNGTTITPKIEPSPPGTEHYERQTVLMWGTSSAANRSPAATPTSNGLYSTENNHLKLSSNQIIISPGEQQHSHQNSPQIESSSSEHMKWSSEATTNNKEIPVSAGVPIYQIHSHQTETASAAVDASSIYALVAHSSHLTPHHPSSSTTSDVHIVSPVEHGSATPSQNHQHVTQQSIGSSCEVWSPAYSQYQYFTYHPAPQHANTQ